MSLHDSDFADFTISIRQAAYEEDHAKVIVDFGMMNRSVDSSVKDFFVRNFDIDKQKDTLDLIGEQVYNYVGRSTVQQPTKQGDTLHFVAKGNMRESRLQMHIRDYLTRRLNLIEQKLEFDD